MTSAKSHEIQTVRPKLQPLEKKGVGVEVEDEMGEIARQQEKEGGKEKGVEEPEEAEVRAPKVARKPRTPTKAEIDAHYPLHADYRDWCPHCKAGKGISNQHRAGPRPE